MLRNTGYGDFLASCTGIVNLKNIKKWKHININSLFEYINLD